jgi:hypothetical protein
MSKTEKTANPRTDDLYKKSAALFAETKHTVTSVSYAQVTEAIHGRASGRWVHYRKHLEPIFPIIRGAAERFGYSLD